MKRNSVSVRINLLILLLVIVIAGGLVTAAYVNNSRQVDRFYMSRTSQTSATIASLLDGGKAARILEILLTDEYQGIRVYVNDRFLTVTENAEPSWVTGDGEALDAAVAALSQPRSGTVKSGNSGDTGDEEESGEEMESSAGLTHPASYGADDLGITPDAPIAPQNYPGGTP